ncbi:MAG: DoxX family membrane protein [Bacteroidetes bacterium]|nr:DoxX family membrane protein [Bacteroidota bacterium]
MLKFFPELSPAEGLAKDTIELLTFGLIPSQVAIVLLAIWEVLVGLMLVLGIFRRFAINLAFVHIIFTFSPMFFFPELVFTKAPFAFTLVGQYIVKNIIIAAALLLLMDRPFLYAFRRNKA